MNELELYVNKKFDIHKIIKMVLKRKGWGEQYTLYSTLTHEVLAVMSSYDFEDKYATFKIKVNEKAGNGYYSTSVNIYTNREAYTINFVNKLFHKSIKTALQNYRKSIFEENARKLYPYVGSWEKSNEEWIIQFRLQEKIDKIKVLDLEEEEIKEMIDSLIDKVLSKHEDEICYKPREKYINAMIESNKEPQILSLIEEINKELEELK